MEITVSLEEKKRESWPRDEDLPDETYHKVVLGNMTMCCEGMQNALFKPRTKSLRLRLAERSDADVAIARSGICAVSPRSSGGPNKSTKTGKPLTFCPYCGKKIKVTYKA